MKISIHLVDIHLSSHSSLQLASSGEAPGRLQQEALQLPLQSIVWSVLPNLNMLPYLPAFAFFGPGPYKGTIFRCNRLNGCISRNRIFTRLLHPQHLGGIWCGLMPYRMPFDTLIEYPEPWLQQTRGSLS